MSSGRGRSWAPVAGVAAALTGALLAGSAWVVSSAESQLTRRAAAELANADVHADVSYSGFDATLTNLADAATADTAHTVVSGVSGTRVVQVEDHQPPGSSQPSEEASPAAPESPSTTPPPVTNDASPTPATPSTSAEPPSYPNLMFEGASASVRSEDETVLRELAEYLTAHPDVMVTLTGYTDNGQDEAGRRALSDARASAAQEVLLDAGVDEARITTVAGGDANPVAPNDTPDGRQLNRRVEITFQEG